MEKEYPGAHAVLKNSLRQSELFLQYPTTSDRNMSNSRTHTNAINDDTYRRKAIRVSNALGRIAPIRPERADEGELKCDIHSAAIPQSVSGLLSVSQHKVNNPLSLRSADALVEGQIDNARSR
jgi:hypothetical protein